MKKIIKRLINFNDDWYDDCYGYILVISFVIMFGVTVLVSLEQFILLILSLLFLIATAAFFIWVYGGD